MGCNTRASIVHRMKLSQIAFEYHGPLFWEKELLNADIDDYPIAE